VTKRAKPLVRFAGRPMRADIKDRFDRQLQDQHAHNLGIRGG